MKLNIFPEGNYKYLAYVSGTVLLLHSSSNIARFHTDIFTTRYGVVKHEKRIEYTRVAAIKSCIV